jgi:hypothetical protein
MHLEADETGGISIIKKVCNGDIVDPCSDPVAYSLNVVFVPSLFVECFYCCLVVGRNRIQPSASCLVIDASAPASVSGVYFDLVSVNQYMAGIPGAVTPDLNARVEECIYLYFVLKNKIGVPAVDIPTISPFSTENFAWPPSWTKPLKSFLLKRSCHSDFRQPFSITINAIEIISVIFFILVILLIPGELPRG